MKIINEIKPTTGWHTRSYLCTGRGNGGDGCGSTLGVEYRDLFYFPKQEYPWRTEPAAVFFVCIVCNKKNDLLKGDWPKNFHELPNFFKQENNS